MNTLLFPKDFIWGGASWATGFEGARTKDNKTFDVWDTWYQTNPERFYDKQGPSQSLNMYDNYEEVVHCLKNLNFNSFRFSISWARFMPQGFGEVNKKAITYYKNLIKELKANNIQPFLCLHHFDLPQCMQDIGGWESTKVMHYFVEYANEVFKHFGHDVAYFLVFNEVGVLPQGGYLYDFQPPNILDFQKSIQVGYNLLLTQAKVIAEYHKGHYPGEIGSVLNPNPVYPRSSDPKDIEAAAFVDMIRERFYLDISINGEIPKDFLAFCALHQLTPNINSEDVATLKNNTIDFLGVNYYQPCRVQAPSSSKKQSSIQWYPKNDKQVLSNKKPNKDQIMPENFYELYDMPNKVINKSRGWEIYPKGIYDTLIRLKENYGNIKCYIGENGMGVEQEEQFIVNGQVQDDYRISFHQEHLRYLHQAIQEGCNCFGYHVWAPIDNWSPLNAFKNRYGFYRFDLKTSTLTIKKSGQWYSKVCKNNGLTDLSND